MINWMLSHPHIALVGECLIHFLWQGFAIALVHSMARRLFGSDPRIRYLIGFLALLILAAAPLMTALALAGPSPVISAPVRSPLPAPVATPVLGWIVAAWAVGAMVMAIRVVAGWVGLGRLVASAQAIDLSSGIERLVQRFELGRPVRFLKTNDLSGPVTFGWIRPVILLPASLICRLTPQQLDAVVAHELAHVSRLDFLANLLQIAVETVLFFHPAVWWISRTVRAEREYCCDDQAATILGDPFAYARALTRVAELQPGVLSLAPGVGGGSLRTRIERLLADPRPARRSTLSLAVILLALPLLVVGVACLTPGDDPSDATVDRQAAIDASEDDGPGSESLAWGWLPERVARWGPQVEVAARRHGLDPELVAIMVWLESQGKADVQSPMGAVGLMQVMPATAREIAEARGLPIPDPTALSDPELSLDLGAWYLARGLEQFTVPGDELRTVELAAAAYNAGPRRVREHLEEGKPLSEETDTYSRMIRALYAERIASR